MKKGPGKRMIEEDYEFECPYCCESNSVRLEASGGSKQSFVQDCTVCCKPIQIKVRFQDDEVVEFSAESQDA